MRRYTFDERNDPASSAIDDRSGMCDAHGCPNRWAVDFGAGRLCSAHSRASFHLWPQVTQEQIDAETDRAWRRSQHVEPAPVRSMSRADKAAAIASLRELASGPRGNPLAWARSLASRDAAGERLTIAQRAAYRDALASRGMAAGDAA